LICTRQGSNLQAYDPKADGCISQALNCPALVPSGRSLDQYKFYLLWSYLRSISSTWFDADFFFLIEKNQARIAPNVSARTAKTTRLSWV
jgi:hypothetical protein